MKMRCFVLAAVLVCSSIAAAGPLDTLVWLEGHWQTEAFGGTIEEVWLPAAGNAMHGVFRLTVDGPPMVLTITEATPDKLVFAGANDESPNRMVYQRVGEELHVTVAGVDGVLKFRRRE